MKYEQFLSEIYKQELYMNAKALVPFKLMVARMLKGEDVALKEKEPLKMSVFDSFMNNDDKIPEEEQDRVGIINMTGMLTKFGSWWKYGTEEYAQMLYEAYADDSIKAIILNSHTPGGSTASVFPIDEALNQRNKPVIGLINSDAFSAGLYTLMNTDHIAAVNNMAELGSIGVMATLQDDKKMLEDYGIVVKEIYPPESKWKNKAVNDALEGDDTLYIEEKLSPWAKHFQDRVKSFRPKLNLEIDGIIEGREFFAKDAVEYGLIDSVMPFNEVVPFALNLAEKRNKYNQLIQ